MREIETDATSLLQLTFLTIDTTTLKAKILGCSYFPIFIDQDTKMPVLQVDQRMNMRKVNRVIHKGAYQMPIFYELPSE